MTMRRALLALGTIVIAAGVARAGGSGAKCNVPIQECLNHMSSVLKQSGWVGIEYEPGTSAAGGYYVNKVVPGSPAEKAGLQPGDVLTALNGVRLATDNEAALQKVRQGWKPGQSVTYTVKRQGQDRDITLTLAPMPADIMAKWIGEHMMEHVAANNVASK
ncbi:MAG TPA: PDZ domain-containing protein [Candidatus Polarisedimenticolaceae bacterium]|nr:PDZ domain-containing protein [Candidatus Polarisedimenticolaceae bacterium]